MYSLRAIEAPVSALMTMFSRSGLNFARPGEPAIPMPLLSLLEPRLRCPAYGEFKPSTDRAR